LGVKVGLAKSVVSPKGLGLEFAKKTFCRGQNISPIPFKEFAASSESLPALIEFMRKYSLSIPQTLKILGFGYKVLGSLGKKWVFHSIKVRRILIGSSIPIDDASFNKWVSQFPKTCSSDSLFAFRALIEKELSRISTWMSKTSQFLSHDYSSWLKEFAFFVSANADKGIKVPITKKTLPIDPRVRELIKANVLSRTRTKLYWDLVQITHNRVRFRVLQRLQDVFAGAFDLYSIDYSTLKVEDRAFFAPFKKYMELIKICGEIPDKSFISMTRCEDGTSATALRDTFMTKIWVQWAPIISGSMPTPVVNIRDLPIKESSLIPICATMLRRVFFTSQHVQSSLIARRLSRLTIPAASFGIRTLFWVWAGEMIYSSVIVGLLYTMYIFAIAKYTGVSSSAAFGPIVLLIGFYFSMLTEFVNQLYAPNTVAHYGLGHWLFEFYILITSVSFFHEWPHIMEAYARNEITGILEHLGFFGGLFWLHAISPPFEILCSLIPSWFHFPLEMSLGEVSWVRCIIDYSKYTLSVISCDYHLLMDSQKDLPVLSDFNPFVDDLPIVDKAGEVTFDHSPVNVPEEDDPWATPKASTSRLPSDEYDTYFKSLSPEPGIDSEDLFSDSPEIIDRPFGFNDRLKIAMHLHGTFYLSLTVGTIIVVSRLVFSI
jgi:hypothetical protein